MDQHERAGDSRVGAHGREIDPVCGMTVDPATAKHRAEHEGRTCCFCSDRCRARFEADPARFLAPRPAAPPVPAGAVHTCPMHPEVRRQGPGSCPICGMALEPLEFSAEAGPNPELADMTRRLRLAAPLAAGVVALEMGGLMPPGASAWVQCALASPVVLWAGRPFFERGWASLGGLRLNMFTLIALGTGAAYLYSLAATLAPGAFPAGFRDAQGAVPVYFEAASVITALALLGQVLELRARERTGDALRALFDLAPKTTHRLRDGQGDEEVSVADVAVGDRLRIRPGEAVPVDGVVLEGAGAVDESMVSGEPMPVAKRAGETLIGGTVNGAGAMVMRAEKVGSDTMLARIVAMVAEAQRSRAPIQRVADGVAAWFVPAVLAAAAGAFAAWALWGPAPALSYALVAAVSVVIVACPCALGLATPMSIGVGVAKGAGAGVLIRSAEALERMERVDTLLVDKTGTLTEGRARVTRVVAAPGFSERDLLAAAAAVERSSEHPLAAAILAAAEAAGAAVGQAADFVSVTGQGVTGVVGGRSVRLGEARLMAGIGFGALEAQAEALRGDGATAVLVAVAGQPAGVIAVADPIKPTTRAALDELRAGGLRVVMLTGDHRTTAEAVARGLGITEVHAGALPQDKHRIVRELKAAGRVVAMAGDGVNDAPALAEADVGIAMGAGTEVAIRSAGITLVRGDLAGVMRARTLSRMTMRNIRQNLVFAFAYNVIGVPVAAGALYPASGILLSPAVAALAMSLSSVSVIANALRLRTMKL